MTISTRLLPHVSLLAIAATLAFPQISAARAAEGQQSGDAAAEEKAEAAEIVVTGSSLKGVAPVGSNLISVSADAIVFHPEGLSLRLQTQAVREQAMLTLGSFVRCIASCNRHQYAP